MAIIGNTPHECQPVHCKVTAGSICVLLPQFHQLLLSDQRFNEHSPLQNKGQLNQLSVQLLRGEDRETVYRDRKSPDHTGTVQFRVGETRVKRSLITVKFNRVHCGGDGSTTVASPFLLCLFVAE